MLMLIIGIVAGVLTLIGAGVFVASRIVRASPDEVLIIVGRSSKVTIDTTETSVTKLAAQTLEQAGL